MSAWTQLMEPGPALLVLILVLTPQLGFAAPLETETEQSSEIEYYPVADATGCYYNFEHYNEGDRIITNEPCLNCTCHNRMLMCYLRVCPFTKAIGQDCKVEKKPDQCCPVITCPEVPVQLLSHASTTPSTALGHLNEYGCSIDSLFYADGAKVPSNPNNPCEVCYCIRNKTACIIQECTLTGKVVEGCQPVYIDGVCCPVRYDCDHPEIETTPRPLLTTTTTTLPPTSAPSDCIYNGEVYGDGALVKKDIPCEKCYCMRGDIVCAVQECGPTPLDKVNCTALPTKKGHCCPDTYECENITDEDLTTLSNYDVPTTQPTIVTEEVITEEEKLAEVPTSKEPDIHVSLAERNQFTEEPTTESNGEEQTKPTTESATISSITSRITEAVEVVTTTVSGAVEAITSTFIGSTEKPESITTDSEKETEKSVAIEQVTEKPEQATKAEVEEGEPEVVTETVIPESETKGPLSQEREPAVPVETEEPHQPATESIPKETEPQLAVTIEGITENPESHELTTLETVEPVAHDDHEADEESHVDEQEKPSATVAPEAISEDEHTRPIDQIEEVDKQQTTQQPTEEIETATDQPIKDKPATGTKIDETQTTETVPQQVTEKIPEILTEQNIKPDITTELPGTEPNITEVPAQDTNEPSEHSQTEITETETPLKSNTEAPITEQESPHLDVTKPPETAITTEEYEMITEEAPKKEEPSVSQAEEQITTTQLPQEAIPKQK